MSAVGDWAHYSRTHFRMPPGDATVVVKVRLTQSVTGSNLLRHYTRAGTTIDSGIFS